MEQILEEEEFKLKLAEAKRDRMAIEREHQQENNPDVQPEQTDNGQSGGQAA